MERDDRQGLLNSRSNRPSPMVTNLFEIGPLRLRERSLKTVKAYISRERLRYNALQIKQQCGTAVKLCAVVKADGYGHGARRVVSCLNDLADFFAVSTIEEAEQIYPFVQGKPILVTCPLFGGMDPQLLRLAQIRGFQGTICSVGALEVVDALLEKSLPRLNLQVKIDTGMGRIGCRWEEGLLLVQSVMRNPKFCLRGIYTHFATADEEDLSFTRRQLRQFETFLEQSGLDREKSVVKHASNTSAALRLPESRFDMVRCGIGIYGYRNYISSLEPECVIRPVLRVEAPLVQVKRLRAGHSCGYGRTFVASREMLIGIVPVGYADGIFRCLSNRAVMRRGQYNLPIVGRISMDYTIVDVSGLPGAREGMAVTVIEDEPDSPCNAATLAKCAETIPYEILTAIGNRIKRELVD